MEQYPISQIDTFWIEKLALDEVNMDQSGVIDLHSHVDTEQILEYSSIHFMEEIRDLFEIYTHKFNQNRLIQDSHRSIKIFKISNTVNDFMLFRNSLKLIIARRSYDVITIGFLSHSGGLYSARINAQEKPSPNVHEIHAEVGAFNEIIWKFEGKKVNTHALVKHYLTEFIKLSAR